MNGIELLAGEGPPTTGGRFFGVTIGIVTNNRDTEGLGRVKVRLPWLTENVESNWARVLSPMTGDGYGLWCLPEVDTEVLVAFEQGCIDFPYVVGSLWNGRERPPESNDNGRNDRRVLRSRSGHTVTLDDTEGAERIIIRDKTGTNQIVLDSAAGTVTIQANQDLKIDVKGNIALSSPAGDVTISCANFKVDATQGYELGAKLNGKVEATLGLALNCVAGVNINNGALEVT